MTVDRATCNFWPSTNGAPAGILWPALFIGAALLPASGELAHSQTAEPDVTTQSVWEGVYSTAQAERGAGIFASDCTECHPVGQFGDPSYIETWAGQTVDALFALIRRQMPYENPGSLSRREYEDVLAYVLSLCGPPAGDADLKSRGGALRGIVIDVPNSADR